MTGNDKSEIVEQSVLDRLVDGELTASERRQLLVALDDVPGGWRRCALAFLEAQSWQQLLPDWSAPPAAAGDATDAPTADPPPPARASAPGSWFTLLAMAASALLAFGLGTLWDSRSASNGPSPDKLTNARPISAPGNSSVPLATNGTGPVITPVSQHDQEPLGFLRMTMGQRDIDVPIYRWGEKGVAFDPADNSDVYRNLRKAGHDVRRVERLVPVVTQNGQVIVPIEQIEIVPVGGHTYQ
jgi:hypothetical protein